MNIEKEKMAEQIEAQNQIQFLLSDFNTRLKDLEERNRLIRERVLLLGKNLITSREEIETELTQIKKDNTQIKKDLQKLKSLTENIVSEINKFARKDEMIVIERMLKDFQPLEFARIKDVEDLINEKLLQQTANKTIKTKKSIK